MATYTLIQDIEAEDKILGPLTLRQFIFALIAVFLFYICALLIQKNIAFLLIIFLPPALFFAFFALPFGRDQPTEVWALAKLRYFFKPRQRVWNQSGVKELVTITVPKKVDRVLTNGLNQQEVESRLHALANTLDTRGWAVKNIDAATYTMPNMRQESSERLIDLGDIPHQVPDPDIGPEDDMLDNQSSPIAQQFGDMMDRSQQEHRQQLINQMNDTSAPAASAQGRQGGSQSQTQSDYWFMDTSSQVPVGGGQASQQAAQPQQTSQIDEAALSAQLKTQSAQHPTPYGNLRTLQPPKVPAGPGLAKPAVPVTSAPDPAILSLANNDDLNVTTLAHEAQRARDGDNPDEVTISLH